MDKQRSDTPTSWSPNRRREGFQRQPNEAQQGKLQPVQRLNPGANLSQLFLDVRWARLMMLPRTPQCFGDDLQQGRLLWRQLATQPLQLIITQQTAQQTSTSG